VSPTRRELLAGAAVGALGVAGVGAYELVDRVARRPPPRPLVAVPPPEQHLLEGVGVVSRAGVEVLVPPLHHAVVTGSIDLDRSELRGAQAALAGVLDGLDGDYPASPAGLGVTVAWGLPYFERFVPAAAARYLPYDRRAGRPALLPPRRFPSDPVNTVLERNDVAVLLRSDLRAHVDDAIDRVEHAGAFRVTSLRRGFVGTVEGDSLPRQMAIAANVPGAELIPAGSELFLGFTSTQRAAFGPGTIANLESLGYVDLRGSDYFRQGTHMHLSHLTEDLESWYVNFLFGERVETAFRPGLVVPDHTQTVNQGPDQASDSAQVRAAFRRTGRIGHSASIQTTSRLQADVVAADGTRYRKGTAVPIRADFNTLDNPFAYSNQPAELGTGPMAGLHFVVFNPSSDDFERNRLAMDGVLPDGTLPLAARSRAQGFNSILSTTHRQNFLVPPRRHRSFPLVEL
jgi:hypothetical protein